MALVALKKKEISFIFYVFHQKTDESDGVKKENLGILFFNSIQFIYSLF